MDFSFFFFISHSGLVLNRISYFHSQFAIYSWVKRFSQSFDCCFPSVLSPQCLFRPISCSSTSLPSMDRRTRYTTAPSVRRSSSSKLSSRLVMQNHMAVLQKHVFLGYESKILFWHIYCPLIFFFHSQYSTIFHVSPHGVLDKQNGCFLKASNAKYSTG